MSPSGMHISRLTLRRDDDSVGRLARLLRQDLDANREHQLLWTLFGDDPDRRRDFLFRRGGGPRSPDGDFLTLSARPPTDSVGLWTIETKPFDPQIVEGHRLAFKLRVNPTVTRDGKRHDVVMDLKRSEGPNRDRPNTELWDEAGRDWLTARAGRLGIAIDALRADGYRVHRIRRDAATEPISIAMLDLVGRLTVRDAEKLLTALLSGVGHGKAWGCGLLLVKPI